MGLVEFTEALKTGDYNIKYLDVDMAETFTQIDTMQEKVADTMERMEELIESLKDKKIAQGCLDDVYDLYDDLEALK